MKGLQLLATGGALPGRVVTNEDLSRQVDTSDEWITTRTGIRQRYYCTESEDAATLAIAAARQALARSARAWFCLRNAGRANGGAAVKALWPEKPRNASNGLPCGYGAVKA